MNRCLNRGLNRRLERYTTRMQHGLPRPSQPNYLAIANRCISAAIRSRKRLAKLMPELFDYATTDREHREHQARREWESRFQPIIHRVYHGKD